jgi:hypothetical protein
LANKYKVVTTKKRLPTKVTSVSRPLRAQGVSHGAHRPHMVFSI